MYWIGNFLLAIATVLGYALHVYMWIIIIGALLSWVNPDPYNPIVRFIRNVTEPVLGRVRKWLPIGYSGMDFSPLIVIFVIYFLQIFLVGSLMDMANKF